MSLLEIDNLKVHFKSRGLLVRAVDGVSLRVEKGESVGLVGESGCGKSSLGNAVIRLVPVTEGRIVYDGLDVSALKGKSLKAYRRRVQMIFQDPFGSLNPRIPVGKAMSEVMKVHHIMPETDFSRKTAREFLEDRIRHVLQTVGLDASYAWRYPHEFSGGQRQRIGIARAMVLNPSLVIADEPVSALDVSVQVQVLNLMKDLQKQLGLSYLFVAHDLAVVRYMCDRVMVMYRGRIVEEAPGEEIFNRPAHPYTEALLSAVPDLDKALRSRKEGSRRIVLKGDVPSASEKIPGCPFHPRCHRTEAICRKEEPPTVDVGKGHTSVCHFAAKVFGTKR